MTIRRAQGATLNKACLYFDHSFPCDRGYAYVGTSKVRRQQDVFLMGKLRRSDWLPVGGGREPEQVHRGVNSDDSDQKMKAEIRAQAETDSDNDSSQESENELLAYLASERGPAEDGRTSEENETRMMEYLASLENKALMAIRVASMYAKTSR